jgi:uncharacterized repeat protein (TIGR03803 family)
MTRDVLLGRVGAMLVAALVTACLPPLSSAFAGETVLHSFCAKTNCPDGSGPRADLIMDGSGNLYGTTLGGGEFRNGTVFELIPNAARTRWMEQVLYSFCALGGQCADGSGPMAGLLMDASGALYGTTVQGGGANSAGTVFKLSLNAAKTKWKEEVVYSFCPSAGTACTDGAQPQGQLIMDSSGNLYGTAKAVGTFGGGVVFKLTPDAAKTSWTESALYDFCAQTNCLDGEEPVAGLIMDAAGDLFGTTQFGGAHTVGTVFKLRFHKVTRGWTYQVLYSFCSKTACTDGEDPLDKLAVDNSERLYGTTPQGGSGRGGTVFELIPNANETRWTEKVLYNFCPRSGCADGAEPLGDVIIDPVSGTLYGATDEGGLNGRGAVFELIPNAAKTQWQHQFPYSFCRLSNCADGANPDTGLVMDAAGLLYGVTASGGANNNGTVFSVMP